MTSRLWPSPKDHPYPRPLQARASSLPSRLRDVASDCRVRLDLVVRRQEPEGRLRGRALRSLCSRVFHYAWSNWKKGSRQLAIEMNANGLCFPEWFDEKVPWSEVMHVDYRHPSLCLEIRDEDRFKPTNSRRIATLTHAVSCPGSSPLPAGLPGASTCHPRCCLRHCKPTGHILVTAGAPRRCDVGDAGLSMLVYSNKREPRGAAVAAAKPRHRPRAEKAAGAPRARDCRT